MTTFEPVRKLLVTHHLSDGQKVSVGQLAQNKTGVYFAYESDYLSKFGNLSPFLLDETPTPQRASNAVFAGLHGVFADSLPDGWGLMLQDRYFRTQGILPHLITPMDRLAFVGERGVGALGFEPMMFDDGNDSFSLTELGKQAELIFDGEIDHLFNALLLTGSSGGARPKAQIFMNDNEPDVCRTTPKAGDGAWIVKFTSQHLPLGHEEGLCEAVYLEMAKTANIHSVDYKLIATTATNTGFWLAVKRFDCTDNNGRLHTHSVAGLLGLDFRLPSLDYGELIKMSRVLCKSSNVGKLQFKRAIFNLLTLNQDDHSKNFAFIQDDLNNETSWQPSPAYDLTFSPTRYFEHSTAFLGYGKNPPKKTIEQLARLAGYDSWSDVKTDIEQIATAIDFSSKAKELGVSSDTSKMIQQALNEVYQKNKGWVLTGV